MVGNKSREGGGVEIYVLSYASSGLRAETNQREKQILSGRILEKKGLLLMIPFSLWEGGGGRDPSR